MKRFTLTRGSDVLAEGVVWTKDGGMIMPAEGGLPWSFAGESELNDSLKIDVSIVWIDEPHEAKSEPNIVNLAPPAYEPPRCKVCDAVSRDGVIEHSKACYQFSAEGGGEEDVDDAHVSSRLDLVGTSTRANPADFRHGEPPTPIACRLCGGDGSQGRPFCSSSGCAHRPQVKAEQMRQAAEQASSYDQLRRTVEIYCPSLTGFLPPLDAATPVTKADLATSDYVREQVTGVDPKDVRGKTPTERALALMDKHTGPLPFGGEAVQRLLWGTLSMLDERLGRAP